MDPNDFFIILPAAALVLALIMFVGLRAGERKRAERGPQVRKLGRILEARTLEPITRTRQVTPRGARPWAVERGQEPRSQVEVR